MAAPKTTMICTWEMHDADYKKSSGSLTVPVIPLHRTTSAIWIIGFIIYFELLPPVTCIDLSASKSIKSSVTASVSIVNG